ncbi:unnamed protein product [Polarella glacialis]|uniref:RING-type E3 ubiquitin transferase n=1 Tax=Polarella glacialis TaxID=89957 RepID=A0A813HCN0_POLGL|nr:unnamed protein product [Polarella glacialis]
MASTARDPEELGENWGKGLARCFSVCEGFLDEDTSLRLLPIPDSFVCPISLVVMRDPVATADGCIYERADIEQWIREKRQNRQVVISPSTGVELASHQLMPVDALKKAIETYVANRPELRTSFGQRRSVQQAAQLLQEELLDKQVRHNSIEDELARLQKQMMDKDGHITEVEVLNQNLSEELERVRAELAERDERNNLLKKEVDKSQQRHQCSQQIISELKSQLASADASCAAGLKEEPAAQSQLCTPAGSDGPAVPAPEADGSAKAPSRALQEIEEEGGDDSNRVLSNQKAEADTLEQEQQEQQQQEETASRSGQSDFTRCPCEAELLSEPSSQSHAGFLVGQYAEIHGLWSRPDLWPVIGRLHEFDEASGRWRLLLDTGEYIKIKPEFMTYDDVPQGVRPMHLLLPEPSGASVTSRLVMSLMSPPLLCEAARLAEHIGALAHEVFGNCAAMRELVRIGGLAILDKSLASASQVVQELAAYALRLVNICEFRTIPRLVALLFESSCSKVQKEAVMTLTSFCSGVSDCRQHILEEISPHKLALLLVPGGANGQSVLSGAALLCGALACGTPSIREALVKAGVIPQIVALLQLAPSTARQAATALNWLLLPACEDIRRSIVEADAIPSLVGLLQSEFFLARENALVALGFLAHESPSNQLAIATAGTGALPVMAKLMRTHALATDVLCRLIYTNADVQGMALEAGLLQSAMCCLEDNGVAGYYFKFQTQPSGPAVVYLIQSLRGRAQVSEQSAAIQLAINILRSGGLESKTLVCLVLWALLSKTMVFDFKDQVIQAGAISCLERMLVQHKLPATSPAQHVLTHLNYSPASA